MSTRHHATRFVLCLTICLAVFLSTARQSSSQDGSTEDAEIPAEIFFVLGNLEYILLHELAHVLINDLEIPVLGSQESAADYLATNVLIRADRDGLSKADRAREFLFATANGLASSWDFEARAGVEVQYWDSHALTIQRFFQIVCLIYGSDPDEFAALPSRVGMPAQRAALCPAEFERADRALAWLLDNYGRREDSAENTPIEIVFERPLSRVSQRVVEAIRASDMLDNTIRLLNERFSLPASFQIVFRTCRQPQALWIEETREISVCYELIDAYYALGVTRRSDGVNSLFAPAP